MKKIAVVALLLTVICLIPLLASAASCPKHPSAKVSTTVTGGYEQHSVVKHKRAAVDTCSVCGDVLQSRYVFDWHQYNGNTCVYCGYVKPAKDELNRDALLLGSDIVNRELWVLYQADIYSGVNGSRVTTARPEEQYYIEAHHEPLVDPGMFDAVQAYFRCGYLRGSWTKKRTRWLESHPEILQRRENCVD